MFHPEQLDEIIRRVSTMDREELIDRCTHFRGRFPVDFTADYLDGLSVDRLRHIYVALCLQNGLTPTELAA